MRYLLSVFLLSLTMAVAVPAAAQTRFYVESGGDPASFCLSPANPCTFAAAMDAADDGDYVAVRVARAGAETVIDEDVDVVMAEELWFSVTTYERTRPQEDAGGTIVLRDNLILPSGGGFQTRLWITEGTTLVVQDSELRVGGTPYSGSTPYGSIAGDLVIEDATIVTTPQANWDSCPSFVELTSRGNSMIKGDCNNNDYFPEWQRIAATGGGARQLLPNVVREAGIFILGSLTVESGTLEVADGQALHIAPLDTLVDDGVKPSTTTGFLHIADGATLTGTGNLHFTMEPFETETDSYTRNTTDCFKVTGGGTLDMTFVLSSRAGVCLDVPNLTANGMSQVHNGGEVFVRQAREMEGSIYVGNEGSDQANLHILAGHSVQDAVVLANGLAQSSIHFWRLNRLGGDVEVIGDGVGFLRVTDANDMVVECTIKDNLGVHLYRGTTIEGDVVLQGNHLQEVIGTSDHENDCSPGLTLRGVSNPARPGNPSVNKRPSQTTTIMGGLYTDTADNIQPTSENHFGGYIGQGDHNFYHNLRIMGMVDMYYGRVLFDMASPAPNQPIGVNYCTGTATRSNGNQLILGGTGIQRVHTHPTVKDTLHTLTVDNTDAIVIVGAGSGLMLDHLDVRAGRLVTGTDSTGALLGFTPGGLLRMTHSHAGSGSIEKFTNQGDLFMDSAGPGWAVYEGDMDAVMGDEAGMGMDGRTTLSSLIVAKPGATLDVMHPLTLARGGILFLMGDLRLHRVVAGAAGGWHPYESKDATLSLAAGFNSIVLGDGDITYPSDPSMMGSIASLAENFGGAPSVTFRAPGMRTAGNLFPGYDTFAEALERAPTISSLEVDGLCRIGGVYQYTHVKMPGNGPWVTIDGADVVIGNDGALDVNGSEFTMVSRTSTTNTTTPQTLDLGNNGRICDSAVGLSCDRLTTGTSSAKVERMDRPARVDGPVEPVDVDALVVRLNKREESAAKTNDRAGWVNFLSGNETAQHRFEVGTATGKPQHLPPLYVNTTLLDMVGAGSSQVNRDHVVKTGQLWLDNGFTSLASSLDQLDVDLYLQMGGSLRVNRPTANRNVPRFKVNAGEWQQLAGEVHLNCNQLTVAADFVLGMPPGEQPMGAVFSVGREGAHYVNGVFYVGDSDSTGQRVNRYRLDTGCTSGGSGATPVPSDWDRGLVVKGPYQFFGVGDSDTDGLWGTVTFAGDGKQHQIVTVAERPGTQFGDVVVHTTGPIEYPVVLGSNIIQNDTGTLTLNSGLVMPNPVTGDTATWTQYNTSSGRIPPGRNVANTGAVQGGSRYSYLVNTPVTRAVEGSATSGGVVNGGVVFPVGSSLTALDRERGLLYFRPITIQYPGAARPAMVTVESMEYPTDRPMLPREGITVPGEGGGMFKLDNVADMFWKVEFDELPNGDPNIRVSVEGLNNVTRVKGLRLVQWDCDMTRPRLAGTYDLDFSDNEDQGFTANDLVNGVPNITHEGVRLNKCSILGVAANQNENPISLPEPMQGFARVQFVTALAGELSFDLYQGDRLLATDLGGLSATGYLPIAAGETQFRAQVQGATIMTVDVPTVALTDYTVVIYGSAQGVGYSIQTDARVQAEDPDMVDVYVVHGAPDIGTVDLRLMDADNTMVLRRIANNMQYGEMTSYASLPVGDFNLELTSADNMMQHEVYHFDLDQHRGAALVLVLNGPGMSAAQGLMLTAFNATGGVFSPPVITSVDGAGELPMEFKLYSNYPNPFNPSTTISFDLPVAADVRLQVVDLLGREVLQMVEMGVDAGYSRRLQLNAASLPSGTYLYALTATASSGDVMRDSGRMVLIK